MPTLKPAQAILCYLGTGDIAKVTRISSPTFFIGSGETNDFRIAGGKVSRYHAKLSYDFSSQRFKIEDLNSTNGTYLQGKKVAPQVAHEIAHKSHLQFSQVPFQFFYSEENPAAHANLPFCKTNLPSYRQILTGSSDYTYQVEKSLKRGGMGSLFKAIRLEDNLPVVIKFLPAKELANTKSVLRFTAEARTIAGLNHENIVKGLDFQKDKELCFLVMEYIEGPNICDLLAKFSRVPVLLATRIVLQVTNALVYLENYEIYHRDIKPENIIWSNDKIAKLVDFGIAKTVNVGLTTQGFFIGTLAYMSPEQMRGESIDTRTDIYALGATYYHMVTGKIPFKTENMETSIMMMSRTSSKPKPADIVCSKVPKQVSSLINKMMHPKVHKRIQSAHELIMPIQNILASDSSINLR